MNGKAKSLMVLIIFYIAAIAFAVITAEFMIAFVASASFFSLSTAVLTNEGPDDSNKNRPAAMIYSFVPGIGHAYLHQYRRAMVFSLGYLAIVCLTLAMIASKSEAIPSFMAVVGVIIGMEFMSLVDVERVCNRLQLPYTGNAYELKVKNYNLAYLTTIFISYIIGAVPSAYILITNNTPDWKICIAIVIVWSLVLITGIIGCIIRKNSPNDDVCA